MIVPAPLHAQARPDGATIDCVYRHAVPNDVALAWITAGVPPRMHQVAAWRVREVSNACEARFHWPHDRSQYALVYAAARLSYDQAVRDLSRWRIDVAVLDQVAADLGPRGRAALVQGDESADSLANVGTTVSRTLANAHVPIPRGAQWREIGGALARAINAMMRRDQATDAFTAP